MASIDFLPVCSNCHQVLWGEEIGVTKREELEGMQKDSFNLKMLRQEVYPYRCPYCRETITSIAMPTDLPFYCEPLRSIIGERRIK